ncbi:hypothetical protein ABMA27_015312 [Loxostege sticticalis]|uniref:DUF4795 domain-containing protein n=1 Tax=Loxostege sticticalis TaxID=481309 RepID=A0ABR3I792_LOXSC
MTDNSTIMSIRELIDKAFGSSRENVVNHKLIQTVLIILAKQLRLLERRVEVEIGPALDNYSDTSLSVTEVKIQANVPRKSKDKSSGSSGLGGSKSMTAMQIIQERTAKSSSAKTKSKSKTSKDAAKSSNAEKKYSPTKSSTEPSSTDKTSKKQAHIITEAVSTDKPSTKKSQITTEPLSADETSTKKSLATNDPFVFQQIREDFQQLLETVEERRERELRIIHQRTNSREERTKTPTPMASLDEIEKQFEELIIVERVPTDGTTSMDSRYRTPRLSVVTQDEFAALTEVVRQLQETFKTAGFPGNAQFLNELRQGASLTDAMTAFQLSARIDAAEKALEKLLSLVTDLAKKTPVVDSQGTDGVEITDQAGLRRKSSPVKKNIAPKEPINQQRGPAPSGDAIDYEYLDNALQEFYEECLKMVTTATTRSNANASSALKIAYKLEARIDESLNLGDRMFELEKEVSTCADQIRFIDTGLTSQMSNYQELMTQMQHDLESGLESMADALANTGGDTAAVAELNNHYTHLQMDIDSAVTRQKELSDMQDALAMDLQSLWKQIEILRDTKSDREEVADALRDKAGLGALNGLVSRQEFDAIRDEFGNHIKAAYEKFNKQEIVWQEAIDDLSKELNDKADWIQVASLQGSINHFLEKFRDKIRMLEEVVGEPRAAAVTRKVFRDAACLSCATPAHMDMESKFTPSSLPAFPSRPPAVGAENTSKPKEDGDHGDVCYPGLQVPHAEDQRAHACRRYCGGSHTLINNKLSRVPPGMIINPALREVGTAVGTDGKLYQVDEVKVKTPCIPCNVKKPPSPESSGADPASIPDTFGSDMTPIDFRYSAIQGIGVSTDMGEVTPPIPTDSDG